jgi:putative PEP-CTERM system TPR-repeat lipoprotein
MRFRSLGWLLLSATMGIWPMAAHADYLSDARDALKKGDIRAAEIDLRNAVRSDPQNGEAHYWLGRVSFELGDPVAAEREASAAIDRGFDPHLADRLLGQALLAQSKFNDILQKFQPEGKDADLDATRLVFRGYAEIGLRQPDAAQKAFNDAEQVAPNAVEPLLAESRLLQARGDLAGAQAKVDKALAVQPKSAEALLAKSQFLRAKGDLNGSLAVLDGLLKDQPSVVQARLDRAGLEIALNKMDLANQDIAMILKATPGNVRAIYLQAVEAAQAKDYKGADADLGKIAAYIPNIPRAYMLLAVVKEQLGQFEQAEDAAQRYLGRAPNDVAAYTILARIEFAQRRPEQVINTLEKVTASGKGDAETYDLLGRAYAATGRAEDAVKAFQQAQSLAPNDIGVQTRLATIRMGMGQPGAAMDDLEHTLELAPKAPAVGEALFFAALATGDMNKAADALAKVKAAQGDTPVVDNLSGLLQMSNLDAADAQKTFAAITQAHPDFMPAQINLARVMAMQGDGAGAEKILAAVLTEHATSEPALTMLASDYAQSNRLSDAIALLERAHAAEPENTKIIDGLGDLYIRAGNAQKALDLVGQTKGAIASSNEVLSLKGSAQLALAQKDQARDTYTQILKQDPSLLAVRRRLVGLLIEAGDFENARNLVKAGMTLAPRNYQLLLDYVMIDLKATGVDAALSSADQLISQDQDFTPARALKGDVFLAANRPEDAAKAYADAMATGPSTMLLTRLVGAQLRAGHADVANALVADWLTKHPDDLVALEQAAELAIAGGHLDVAAKHLQGILAIKPHDSIALNNLAWVYQQQHDPRAMDLARQAYVLAPGAQTADTLGWILTTGGKADTGVLLLRQASAQAASDPRVQYHYAVALKDTGDKADAIKLLTAVVAVKADFTEKPQAQQLLDELNKGT